MATNLRKVWWVKCPMTKIADEQVYDADVSGIPNVI